MTMPQMSREEAIEFCELGAWKNWSPEEIVRFQIDQDKLCVPLDAYFEALQQTTGRRVMTHELSLNAEGIKDEMNGIGEPPNHEEMLAAFDVMWLEHEE